MFRTETTSTRRRPALWLILAIALAAAPASAKPRHHAKTPESAEIVAAKAQLSAARHHAKIAKLAAKAAAAIEACEEAVVIACEDTTERATDSGECEDSTLRAKHAFDVCTGHGPAFVAEGK